MHCCSFLVKLQFTALSMTNLGLFLSSWLVQVSHAASYNKLHNEQPQCLVSTSVKLWKAQMSFVVAKLCSVPSVEGKWCSFWSKASPPRVVCCELLNVWYFLYKMCKLLNVKYLVWEMCKLLNALCVALRLAGCEMGRVNLCKTCQHLSQWQPVQYCQRRHHLQQQLRHHHLQWHHMVIVIKTTRLRQM